MSNSNSRKYWFLGISGSIAMILGLAFKACEAWSIPLVTVGGSLIAAALANWYLTRHLDFLPLGSIAEALAKKVEFFRVNHEAVITFSIDRGRIRLDKTHKYCLSNPRCFPRWQAVTMFTDDSRFTGEEGGFRRICGPDGVVLNKENFGNAVTQKNGKHIFRKRYWLKPCAGSHLDS